MKKEPLRQPAGPGEKFAVADYWQVWGTSVQEPDRWQPWGPPFSTEEHARRDLLAIRDGAAKGGLLASAARQPARLRLVRFRNGFIRKAFPKLRNRPPRKVVAWFRRALRAYRAVLEQVYQRAQNARDALTSLAETPSDRRLTELNARIDAYNDEVARLQAGPQRVCWRRLPRLAPLTWVELERATRNAPPAKRPEGDADKLGRDLVADGDNRSYLSA